MPIDPRAIRVVCAAMIACIGGTIAE